MSKVYQIWCEWDIGHVGMVFKSKDAARKWAAFALEEGDIEIPYDQLEADGLVTIETLELNEAE